MIEVNAEYEQFENWNAFQFIMPDKSKLSLPTKDDCGYFYVSDLHINDTEISFLKHYTEGTVMFGDSDEKIVDTYVIRYKGIKQTNEKEYHGTWKNVNNIFDSPENKGKSKISIEIRKGHGN